MIVLTNYRTLTILAVNKTWYNLFFTAAMTVEEAFSSYIYSKANDSYLRSICDPIIDSLKPKIPDHITSFGFDYCTYLSRNIGGFMNHLSRIDSKKGNREWRDRLGKYDISALIQVVLIHILECDLNVYEYDPEGSVEKIIKDRDYSDLKEIINSELEARFRKMNPYCKIAFSKQCSSGIYDKLYGKSIIKKEVYKFKDILPVNEKEKDLEINELSKEVLSISTILFINKLRNNKYFYDLSFDFYFKKNIVQFCIRNLFKERYNIDVYANLYKKAIQVLMKGGFDERIINYLLPGSLENKGKERIWDHFNNSVNKIFELRPDEKTNKYLIDTIFNLNRDEYTELFKKLDKYRSVVREIFFPKNVITYSIGSEESETINLPSHPPDQLNGVERIQKGKILYLFRKRLGDKCLSLVEMKWEYGDWLDGRTKKFNKKFNTNHSKDTIHVMTNRCMHKLSNLFNELPLDFIDV